MNNYIKILPALFIMAGYSANLVASEILSSNVSKYNSNVLLKDYNKSENLIQNINTLAEKTKSTKEFSNGNFGYYLHSPKVANRKAELQKQVDDCFAVLQSVISTIQNNQLHLSINQVTEFLEEYENQLDSIITDFQTKQQNDTVYAVRYFCEQSVVHLKMLRIYFNKSIKTLL